MLIHERLKQRRFPNCTSLRKELEVKAVRTILRDIDFMRDQLRLPIEYDDIAHGYFYSRPVEQFPGVTVSESELFALLVARKAVAHYRGTPFHRPLRTAFDKLAAGLDPKTVVHLENLGDAMDIRVTGPEDLDEATFLIVSRAVHQHRPLRFKYRKHAAKTVEARTIKPYQLVCANHRWYVVGHDLRRDGIRVFVLGRMLGAEVLDGVFKRPADFR
ncbi:MAG: WYL domain-containing protein, partial [Phycisphaerales bacterium]|nr:WYL domain-containing protein [Phycisphaerales bacterium]